MGDLCYFNDFNTYSLSCWNINGVKQKFEHEEAKNLFAGYVVMETHFVKRHKLPENFEVIGESLLLNRRKLAQEG